MCGCVCVCVCVAPDMQRVQLHAVMNGENAWGMAPHYSHANEATGVRWRHLRMLKCVPAQRTGPNPLL